MPQSYRNLESLIYFDNSHARKQPTPTTPHLTMGHHRTAIANLALCNETLRGL